MTHRDTQVGDDRSIRFVHAMVITCVLGWMLTALAIVFSRDYGVLVFLILPFLIAAIPAYVSASRQRMGYGPSVGTGLLTLLAYAVGVFAFGIEGAICILMAAPLCLVAALVGAFLGHRLGAGPRKDRRLHLLVPMLLLPGAYVTDETLPSGRKEYQVVSTVDIDAPPSVVWQAVLAFPPIAEPEDLLFRLGIAYPTHATLSGEGVGAIRECHFSTGTFVEPITTWEENRVLAFDVTDQPFPMKELTPWPIHPPHLDGYFRSVRGRFDLEPIGKRSRLTGTTWYVTRLMPEWYWTLWTDAIVHRIHGRVLRHIEATAEGRAGSQVRP